MRIFVFDTETTGLPKTKQMTENDLPLWPHIVQLSYIIYNDLNNDLETTQDHIIQLPENIIISQECVNIHGITNERCKSEGGDLKYLLRDFLDDFYNCDLIVGHNLQFDLNMLRVEIMRIIQDSIYFEKEYFEEALQNLNACKKYYCTMQESIDLCDIQTTNKRGVKFVKYPKLLELHEKLFQCKPQNLHNSLNDVLVTMRCFYMLKNKKDIIGMNAIVNQLWTQQELG